MNSNPWRASPQSRRSFLKRTAIATAGAAGTGPLTVFGGEAVRKVVLVPTADDIANTQPPAQWAIEHLRSALAERGLQATVERSLEEVPKGSLCVLAGSNASALVRAVLEHA